MLFIASLPVPPAPLKLRHYHASMDLHDMYYYYYYFVIVVHIGAFFRSDRGSNLHREESDQRQKLFTGRPQCRLVMLKNTE